MECINFINKAVQNINNRFVFHGISPEAEHFIPLLEVRVVGSEISVNFLSFVLWDNGQSFNLDTEESLEKFLMIEIDKLRSVVNHVTSAITPAFASASRI